MMSFNMDSVDNHKSEQIYNVPSVKLGNLYLLACQVRVTVGNSGLDCWVHVMSFDR